MPEVVCLGIVVVDVWARPVDQWPARGTLGLVEEVGIGLGGCAANCGLDFIRLGGRATVMGCVGRDGLGDFALNTLQEGGAQTAVRRVDVPTSATLITIHPDGERTFLHCTGADGAIEPDQVDMAVVTSAPVLALLGVNLMPGFDGAPQATVLARAKQQGVTTVVDTAWDDTGRWMETLAPLLPYTDLLLPSVGEARGLTGREDPPGMAQVLLEQGPSLVGIKLGPEGSYLRTAEQELWIPAYPVETVDGTGAGDAFVAGFLYGWQQGWELRDVGRFANAVGALSTTALGTTRGVRSAAETIRFLEEAEGMPWSAPLREESGGAG